MKIQARVLIPSLCLVLSSAVFAHGGGGGRAGGAGGAGYHGGPANGGYHNNGADYNHGYNHNNGWYGGAANNNYDHNVWYDEGVGDDVSTNVVVGVPESGYYDPSCQITQSCNSDGECVTQQNCN